MDFKTSQKIFSAARMGKYANACSVNEVPAFEQCGHEEVFPVLLSIDVLLFGVVCHGVPHM